QTGPAAGAHRLQARTGALAANPNPRFPAASSTHSRRTARPATRAPAPSSPHRCLCRVSEHLSYDGCHVVQWMNRPARGFGGKSFSRGGASSTCHPPSIPPVLEGHDAVVGLQLFTGTGRAFGGQEVLAARPAGYPCPEQMDRKMSRNV